MGLFGSPNVEKLKAKGDVAGLIKALGYEKDNYRKAAAEALGQIGAPAVGPLVAALHSPDGSVRWHAAGALGQTGDADAVKPLIAAFGDPLVSVRSAAVEALVQVGAPAVGPLIDALPSWAAAEALGRIGDHRAVKSLVAALPNWAAINALGWIGDPGAVAPLIAALQGKDELDREAAARALGRIGDPAALDALTAALSDEAQHVREAAAEALKHLPRVNS